MSIIIDGMDQNSTQLPHTKRLQKSDAHLWHFRTHLTGAILHGHWATVFLDYLQWPHDPNLTINVLLQVSYIHNVSSHDLFCILKLGCTISLSKLEAVIATTAKAFVLTA